MSGLINGLPFHDWLSTQLAEASAKRPGLINAAPPGQSLTSATALADEIPPGSMPTTRQVAANPTSRLFYGGKLTPEGIQHARDVTDTAMAMGGVGPSGGGAVGRMAPGLVEVPAVRTGEGAPVTAYVNPGKSDLARMMEATDGHHLRVLQEGPNIAVWPALDATHGQMAAPLGFSKGAALVDYRGRPGAPDADYPNQVGRFSFFAAEH